MLCPRCSRDVPDGSTFCAWCGASMVASVCPHCGAKTLEGAPFCPSCGKQMAQPVKAAAQTLSVSISPSAPPTPEASAAPRPTAFTPSMAPQSQGIGSAMTSVVAEPGFRQLTQEEVGALKNAASWEIQIAQVTGFVAVVWGLIGYFAPVEDPFVFSMIGLVPAILAFMAGLAAKQKMLTSGQAIANGRAAEFTGTAGAGERSLRRIDFSGGYLTFAAARVPKVLDEAVKTSGGQLKVTFTEGGTETKTGTETMILAVNGSALSKPVLGTMGVSQ